MFHKRLLREFRDSRKYVVEMVLAQWISLVANILLMLVTAEYIDHIFRGDVDKNDTIKIIVSLVVVLLVRGLMTSWGNKLSFQVSAKVKSKLRDLVYEKLMKLGSQYREYISTSEIVQISTEGVEQLEIYFGKYVPQFFYSVIAPLTLFCIIGSMSIKVALVLLLCVPLIPLSIVAVQKFAKKILKKYWGIYTELGDSFLECLNGLTTLKIYQADERYAEKMDKEAENFRKVTMRVLVMQLNSISIMDLVAYGGAAVGIILAVLEFKNNNLSLSQTFFTVMIAAEFFLPLRLLGSFFHIAMNGNTAADKIFQFLDQKEKEQGAVGELIGNEIKFNEVTFGYSDERNVLESISLHIKDKGIVAVAGVSGCGKSTLASMVMGEIAAKKGSVLIDGKDIKDIHMDALRRKITRVRHDSYLFQGTVKENLLFGNKNATEEMMTTALKKVRLWDFISEKGGFSMQLLENAANLSGGQKQRLALARAVLHDSDIYIFDEATSNIDVESENQIMEVVREMAKTKVVILISHRLANVTEAKCIYVLDHGKIVESGTHSQLIANKKYYHQLFEEQKRLESSSISNQKEEEVYA